MVIPMNKRLLCAVAGAIASVCFAITPATSQTPSAAEATVIMTMGHVINCQDLSKVPADVTIHKGEAIILTRNFKGDPGLYDPADSAQIFTTDGQSGDVLQISGPVKRLTPDEVQIAHVVALRAGEAEIRFIRFNNKLEATIKVHVQ
jgi:hypothetical protein